MEIDSWKEKSEFCFIVIFEKGKLEKNDLFSLWFKIENQNKSTWKLKTFNLRIKIQKVSKFIILLNFYLID